MGFLDSMGQGHVDGFSAHTNMQDFVNNVLSSWLVFSFFLLTEMIICIISLTTFMFSIKFFFFFLSLPSKKFFYGD